MEYTYTIIDSDSSFNPQLLSHLDEYGEFVCLNTTDNSDDGVNAILKYNPSIVFVHLNRDANAHFKMVMELHQYINDLPIIIGISKSKRYAYEAIKNGFFDYWLLPCNEFDMRKSILKLTRNMPVKEEPNTLCLKSYKDYRYLNTNEILYLKADNNTTDFVMHNGTVISAYKTLKTFETRLPKNFVRIHQSYILNMDHVSRINYGKSICALKSGGTQLPFSKSYRENIDSLKKLLSKNTISTLN